MSSRSLVFKQSQPPHWLSGDINEASNPVTVTLHGEDGFNVSGVPLTFLVADSKFVKDILLVHDEAEEDKQITLASTSTETIFIYVSLICTGSAQLHGDRTRKETIVRKLEDLLILLQSQIKLDTRSLFTKHEQDAPRDEDLRCATVAEVNRESPEETSREDGASGFSIGERKKVKTEDGELETTVATDDTSFELVPQVDRLSPPSVQTKCEDFSSVNSTSETHATGTVQEERDQGADVDGTSMHEAEKSLKSKMDQYSFKQHKKCMVNVKNYEVRVKNVRVDVKRLDKY